MDEIQEDKKLVPPYVSYKTFLNVLDRLKVGIPSRIDRSVLGTFSGAVQGQLFSTLKFLGLISSMGIPTPDLLHRLVKSEGPERQKVLKEVLISAYPFLFNENIDLKSLTSQMLEELFSKQGSSGETTKRCVAFFMAAAKDNGIQLSPHLKKVRGLSVKNGGNKLRKVLSDKKPGVLTGFQEAQQNTSSTGWQELLLSKFPTFDPAWPDEVKVKWFEGFKDLMGEFKKQ